MVNTWVVECSVSTKEGELEIEHDDNMANSMYIRGGDARSMCALPAKSFFISLKNSESMLIVEDWRVTRTLDTLDELALGRHLLLPNFDLDAFPFMITYEMDTFFLLNIRTGHKDALIKGSARNEGKYPAIFFVEHGSDDLELHFCTVTLNDRNNTYEQTWHCMELKADFVNTLKKYGQLPLTSIGEQLDLVVQVEEQQKLIE